MSCLHRCGTPRSEKAIPIRIAFSASVVEPEGFEPSSKHGTCYAFYMLSCCLIVGKGKVNRLPVPSSVDVLSYRIITPLNPGQSCCSMLLVSDYRTESDGTKAYLILN